MFDRPRHLRRVYLFRIAILLTVLIGLFAEDLFPTLDNSRLAAASPFAACVAPCFENFDNVTAPALPAGWTATLTTGQPGDTPWTTVNSTSSDTAPNSAFASSPNHVTDNQLTSRNFGINTSTTAVLTFSRSNNLESNFDGMVLEISIDGNFFQDIITAGGSFVSGGYNGTITLNSGSPIGGRSAWTGNSGGFVTTTVNLPASANRRTVRLRWRVATDSTIGNAGAFIDSINLTGFVEPPANDNFANAQPILGSSGVIISTNLGAGKEPNEPNHAGNAGTASIWFRWQAPSDGKFTFTTVGSGTDTLLAVYTGSSLPGTLIQSNDDVQFPCFSDKFSDLSFDAIGGVMYHIAVDRKSFTIGGDIRLRWGRSATISGKITDASLRLRGADTVQLSMEGGGCYRRSDPSAGLLFTNVPTGANYTVDVHSPFSTLFNPYPGNPSISPLTGNVSNLNFYQSTPAYSISGTVTNLGNDTSDLTVTCASTPGNLVSRPAANLGAGKYQCSGLPHGGDYVITPSKLGFIFTPPSLTEIHLFQNVSFVDFEAAAAPTRTISGRVTSSGGTGVNNVSIALSGFQTASTNTDANGNYSFTGIPQGGNYTVTPSNTNITFTPPSQSFNNLTADQTADFTATFLLQLVLDDSGQVAALNSLLLIRDPFAVIDLLNQLNTGVDRNTRVSIFLANFQLAAGESPASVVVNLVGSNNQSFDVPAEVVMPLSQGFTQVTFRLPDALTSGTCVVAVKAHGLTSNMGVIKIKN